MGKVDATKDRVTRHELRHDRPIVSLIMDHLVFSPKYRGEVLEGEVAEAAEDIIRETCKELNIEVIDEPFFRKESFVKETIIFAKNFGFGIFHTILYNYVSGIAKRIKGRSSKFLRDKFPHLGEWSPEHLWTPSCYHGSVGRGWEVVEKYISGQKDLLQERKYYTRSCS